MGGSLTTDYGQEMNVSSLPEALTSCFANGEAAKKLCFKSPKVWGPPTWFFLHSMTLALPEKVPEDKQVAIENLMESLTKLLPCPSCGVHLGEHMQQIPLDPHIGKRDSMVQWMVDIHNLVNKDVGKSEVTKDEMMKEYREAYTEGS